VNDSQIDRLVQQAQPRAEAVASLALGRGGQELLEEIMSTPNTPEVDSQNSEAVSPQRIEPVELPTTEPRTPAPRRRRQALIGLAAAVAVAAAVAGPTVLFQAGDKVVATPGSDSQKLREAAVGSPRLLIDDPTWKITVVDDLASDNGGVTFTKGTSSVNVSWAQADRYQDRYDDRLDVSAPVPFQILGRGGNRFRYDATDFAVMLPPEGKTFLEIRGTGVNETAFAALMAKLKKVSVEEWLAAMPASAFPRTK
jgi:hypothetical protein